VLGDAATPVSLFSPCLSNSDAPNRSDYTDPYDDVLTPTTTYDHVALTIRRRLVNNTGQPITRLRFRVISITTFPSATTADLRLLTSPDETITDPCTGTTRAVKGLKLEQGEAVVQPNGGGYNSTVSLDSVTPSNPLPAFDDPATPQQENAVDLEFLLGVSAGGDFQVFFVVETLP